MNERKKKYLKIQLDIILLENQILSSSPAYNFGKDDNVLVDPFV
jgi:hypothetical protein